MNNSLLHSFSKNPINLDIARSKFNRPSSLKTSFNNGMLVPIYCDEVLPGDTFKMTTKLAMRLSTLIKPIMDDIYCDIYYFYVPNRIIWDNFEEFMGENKDGYWTVGQKDFEVPHFKPYGKLVRPKSLSDYLGVPVDGSNIDNAGISNDGKFHYNDLYRRAYYEIWNEWFRDQNLQPAVYVPHTSGDYQEELHPSVDYDIYEGSVENAYSCDRILPVCKLHDYFTSALPSPQKGPDVSLFSEGAVGVVPVETFLTPFNIPDIDNRPNMTYHIKNGENLINDAYLNLTYRTSEIEGLSGVAVNGDGTSVETLPFMAIPNNLGVNFGNASSIGTINDLRLAFALQRYYEKAARGGTRYREIIQSFFGVTSPDSRMQIPEYLGGTRFRVNVSQVVQTSSTDTESPQGNMAGYSLTNEYNESFTKSFVEHGILMAVACTRHKHTYQQGVNRQFLRRDLFDYYNPTFANIGEQPIRRVELYSDDLTTDITDFEEDGNGIFGYQEAWAEYRYKPSIVTSEMRSAYPQSLDIWHLADFYDSRPYLNSNWIKENKDSLDRVLAVTSELSDQFQADFMFDCVVTRAMPLYSIPGLIDHN